MAGTSSSVSKTAIRKQRGPLNALVAKRMRELNLPNVVSFAEHAGLSDTAMYEILNGRVVKGVLIMPKWQSITKLAKALAVPTHELLYLLDPEAPGANAVIDAHQVPVYIAGHVGAGPEQLVETDDKVYVEKQFASSRDLIAFHVRGDSMAGGKHPIYNGDIVIVDQKVGGELNFPVVARLKGDGYVVKRLRPGNILDSTNPEFIDSDTALIAPDRVAHVVGRVVRVIANMT
ncbi:S24 family peptidase [Deinococcus kurensis]|uniref:S24 family peptidase n=1 Tax=Deinococcus kurensis TaxID=2662757 RepID=UPI0013920351|nr:S24 family peptidase [Deinococcus kurensis]